jgi:hypothetical protein
MGFNGAGGEGRIVERRDADGRRFNGRGTGVERREEDGDCRRFSGGTEETLFDAEQERDVWEVFEELEGFKGERWESEVLRGAGDEVKGLKGSDGGDEMDDFFGD